MLREFGKEVEGFKQMQIEPNYDASRLSDEFCGFSSFSGAFVGMCCQDMAYRSALADFDYFTYREKGD